VTVGRTAAGASAPAVPELSPAPSSSPSSSSSLSSAAQSAGAAEEVQRAIPLEFVGRWLVTDTGVIDKGTRLRNGVFALAVTKCLHWSSASTPMP
jgi:hypothetical protein